MFSLAFYLLCVIILYGASGSSVCFEFHETAVKGIAKEGCDVMA